MAEGFADTALILVDIQNDFCPGGALAVAEGDQIVDVVNRVAGAFPLVISTQDWHPADHISFKERGGPWPPHCVQGTEGAALHPALDLSQIAVQVRKAATADEDVYSGFDATDKESLGLDEVLKSNGVRTLYIAGLATDYCVRATVLDGLMNGYDVYVITDAVRAVNVNPGDGQKALEEMASRGARLVTSNQILLDRGVSGASAR
jgi:nicotinamidase/pyrazinamidase